MFHVSVLQARTNIVVADILNVYSVGKYKIFNQVCKLNVFLCKVNSISTYSVIIRAHCLFPEGIRVLLYVLSGVRTC